MNKLLFAAAAIAALSMLAPSSGIAEPTHPNEIGIYLAPDATGPTGSFILYDMVFTYLVLTIPRDLETGEFPSDPLVQFSLRISAPFPYIIYLEIGYIYGGTNDGSNELSSLGFADLQLQYSPQIPMIIDSETYAIGSLGFTNYSYDPGPFGIFLGPIPDDQIEGQMYYSTGIDENVRHHIMYPISGSHDDPVFLFNGYAVPVENESFGSVKALYR